MSYLIFVEYFKFSFSIHVTVVLHYIIKQPCSIFFLMWLEEFFSKVNLGVFFFHVECRWVLSEPLPHHYGTIISPLHHTEMYSERCFSFILQRCFSHIDDTVLCTEYINTI